MAYLEMQAIKGEGDSDIAGTGSSSEPLAPRVPRVYRIAVGLFGEWQALGSVLSELSDEGLDFANVCLIRRCDSNMSELESGDERVAEAALAHVAALIGEARDVPGLFSQSVACAGSGGLFERLCETLLDAPIGAGRHPVWLSPDQYRRLGRHVERGGLLLIVSSETPAQQDASSRILLRYSRHSVNTYDFTL